MKLKKFLLTTATLFAVAVIAIMFTTTSNSYIQNQLLNENPAAFAIPDICPDCGSDSWCNCMEGLNECGYAAYQWKDKGLLGTHVNFTKCRRGCPDEEGRDPQYIDC